jgi:hypothetical protein
VRGKRLHDLRHTAGSPAACVAGAKLMARLAHSSLSEALIYQHTSAQSDRSIPEELSAVFRRMKGKLNSFEESGRSDNIFAGRSRVASKGPGTNLH